MTFPKMSKRFLIIDFLRRLIGIGGLCPECKVKPDHRHIQNCTIGKSDGGVWA